MPTGPQGQKRPADAIGLAVMIGKIATGEIEEPRIASRRSNGRSGGLARAESMTPEQRIVAAKKAAGARWG